ncbi:MAG: O-antigen ligase family protein [Chloroflexi bacterium]|nr:O-antigen ligase family protein [Chloroflexota bacterium]
MTAEVQRRSPAPARATATTPPAAGAWIAQRADAAAFGVLLTAVVAIPVTFSIATSDVFAMPRTVVAVGLATLLLVLLGARWIASGYRLRDLRWSPLAWAVAVFAGWNVLAGALSIDPRHSLIGEPRQFQGLGTTMAYVVYLLAGWATVRGPRRQSLLLGACAIGAAVVSTYAVIQGADLDPIWTGDHERVFSTIGQANALAAYLVLAVPLTLALGIRRHLAVQVLITGLVVLQLVALAFTLSRGGFLGAGVAAAALLALLWRRRREVISRHAIAIVGAAAIVGGTLVLGVPDLRDGAERALDRIVRPGEVEEASTSAHLDQWAVGLAIVADHAVVGAGQETYPLLFDDYRDTVIEPDRARVWRKYRPESPHNHYLAIAGGAGVPALVAYLAIIGLVVWRAARSLSDVDRRTLVVGACIVAAIAGHVVTDGFMTAETAGSVLFWTLLGVAAALGGRSGGGTDLPGPVHQTQE